MRRVDKRERPPLFFLAQLQRGALKVTRLAPVGLDFKQHLSKQMGHLNKSL